MPKEPKIGKTASNNAFETIKRLRYETSKQHFRSNLYLKKQKATQAGKAPIYARVTVNGKRLEISVKRSVEDKSWNPVKGILKGSREEITKLNQHLDQFKAGIVEAISNLQCKRS